MNLARHFSTTRLSGFKMPSHWEKMVRKNDPDYFEDPNTNKLMGSTKYSSNLGFVKNFTVLISTPGWVVTENRKLPKIHSGDILIRIGGVMLNEADIQLATYGTACGRELRGPHVPGSNAGGVVLSTFGVSTKLIPGDRVVLDPRVYCGACKHCEKNKYADCAEYTYSGLPPTDGFLTQYVLHPADFCYKIPDDMSLIEACSLPMMARCYELYKQAAINPKKNLLVIGGGVLGLTIISIAKTLGVGKIFAIDPSIERLVMCKDYGADFVLKVKPFVEARQFQPIVRGALEGSVDVTFCTTVTSDTLNNAIYATNVGGTIILGGIINPLPLECNFQLLTEKQQTLIGNQDHGDNLEKNLRIMKNKIFSFLNLTPLSFPMSLAANAFSAASYDIPIFPLVYLRCNYYIR